MARRKNIRKARNITKHVKSRNSKTKIVKP
jgi:hypothetical protein